MEQRQKEREEEKLVSSPEESRSRIQEKEETGVRDERRPKRKTKAGRIFLRVMEVLAIVLSFLESSRIARFLTAKVSMDVVVEVTDKFGTRAGHRMSSILALIVAEPRIIAVAVTGVILVLELILGIVRLAKAKAGKRRRRRDLTDRFRRDI